MDIDKTKLLDILLDCSMSTRTMATTFFPDHCYRPFGAVHDPLFKILDNDSIRLALIVCPRGFGKTTITGLVFPAKKMLFKDVHYVLYISSTAMKAISDVQTIASEMKTNEMLTKVFGRLEGIKWAEGTGVLDINVKGEDIRLEAKGAGHQIRGLKFKHYRPDLIIIDDLEDPEQVANEDRRAKLKKWLFADVLNSVDLDRTRVVMMGTVLHEDSLIQNILDEDSWKKEVDALGETSKLRDEVFTSIRIEACNDKLEATWPEFMSTDKIRAKAAAYEKRGLLDVFFREMRNLIIPSQGAAFEKSMFQHYEEDFSLKQGEETIIIGDPAKTTNFASADSAVVGVGFTSSKNRICLKDSKNGKMHPEQFYLALAEMADRLHTPNIAIEVTSLNEFITFPLKAFLARRYRHYNVIELKARGKKEDRIRALVPFYRLKKVWHNEDIQIRGPIESQLMVFPNGKLVDVIDAFAYCIELFDLGDRMFSMELDDLPEEQRNKLEDDEFSVLEEDDYAEHFQSRVIC
jgi:hypothetical protein